MNNVFLAILTHKCPQNCVIVHINPFLLHTIQSIGKNSNSWLFYMLKEIRKFADIFQQWKLACGQRSTFSMSAKNLGSKKCWYWILRPNMFLDSKFFWNKHFFGLKKLFLTQKFCRTQNLFGPKILFWPKKFQT